VGISRSYAGTVAEPTRRVLAVESTFHLEDLRMPTEYQRYRVLWLLVPYKEYGAS
jgi:hypothetical protein